MLLCLTKEFKLMHFQLRHSDASDFVKSQWQKSTKSITYFIYRWFVALVFITNITLSLQENKSAREWKIWAIYLTRWGLLLNVISNTLAAILVTLQNCSKRFQQKLNVANELPAYIKCYWALHSITVTLAVLITIAYWGVVHGYGTPITLTNFLNHAANSVMLIIDLLIVGHPHRILHLIYTHLIVVAFMIFSLIYYVGGGRNLEYKQAIYPLLDWTKVPRTLLFCVGFLIIVALLHICLHGIYRLRFWIYKSFRKRGNSKTVVANDVLARKLSTELEIDNHAFVVQI